MVSKDYEEEIKKAIQLMVYYLSHCDRSARRQVHLGVVAVDIHARAIESKLSTSAVAGCFDTQPGEEVVVVMVQCIGVVSCNKGKGKKKREKKLGPAKIYTSRPRSRY